MFTIAGLSFLIPNIHILLTLAGSVLGTIVNIILPVLFYNRAYNWSDKNYKLQKKGSEEDPEKEKLMEIEGEEKKATEEPKD